MSEWQPIETAPRDGRDVLVMRDIWLGTESGRAEECNGHNTYVAAWWGSEWVCYMDQVQDPRCPIEPTHWMPLPSPPAVQTTPIETELCPSCNLPYSNGDTCPANRGGCPMGGDF